MSAPTLRAVPTLPEALAPETHLICQAHLRGHQETTVRVLVPVNGSSDSATVAVRVGPLLLLIEDQAALDDVAGALHQARRLGRRVLRGLPPQR